jgi:phosphoglycolate phosphatase
MSSSRTRRFDLIAFDWDGTLFDSTRIIVRCIQRAVADVGGTVPTDQAAAYVIGMGLMEALAHAAPDVPKDKYPELGARYRHHYVAHQDDLCLFDGVLPLLGELRAASIGWPWPRASRAAGSTMRCERFSSMACSMVRGPRTRPPASRIR